MESVPTAEAASAPNLCFEDVFREYRPCVWGFVLKLTGDRHAADDLCQEVFVRAFRTMHTLLHKEKIRSWLFSIGYHATVDWIRRNAADRRLKKGLGARTGELPLWSLPEKAAMRRERDGMLRLGVEEVWRHVERLPPRYRRVIELRYRKGLSLLRIAETEGVALGNVKVRLHRARKRLAREMEEWESFFRQAV
jgi:RNA polymerase sigma-70 factor, ECF subfamily